MTILVFLLLVMAGMASGILAGLFGVGGGILFAPLLLFLFQSAGVPEPVLWTVGTSLFCNFMAALSSVIRHYQMGNVYVREAVTMAVFGIAGTVAGRFIATSPYYSEREFTLFFVAILLYSTFQFLRKKKQTEVPVSDGSVKTQVMRIYQGPAIGFLSGILAALAGVGGGILMVPAMIILLGFEYRKAVSISSAAIILITLSAWLQFSLLDPASSGLTGYHIGYLDFGAALPIVGGSFFAARYGVSLILSVRLRTLEIFFGLLLALVALRLIVGLAG